MSTTKRYLHLDYLKVAAITTMIIYHAYFVAFFTGLITEIPLNNAIYEAIGHFARWTFLILVGINAHISTKKLNFPETLKHLSKRALKIGLAATAVTLVSYIFLPAAFIRYGILHFIATALLLIPFINYNKITLAVGLIGSLALKYNLAAIDSVIHCHRSNYLCQVLGFNTYSTIDYFGLLNWLPLICIALILANLLYQKPPITKEINKWQSTAIKISKNALTIYLLHPIVLTIIALLISLIL